MGWATLAKDRRERRRRALLGRSGWAEMGSPSGPPLPSGLAAAARPALGSSVAAARWLER
eukprot:9377506-Alexandrium_andersonii.AAC.1